MNEPAITWLAWAAGLFDGEGSVTRRGGRPRLQLKMVDEVTVRRFHVIVGEGTVYGPYKNRAGEKDGYPRRDFFLWVADGDAGWTVADVLAPWLSPVRMDRINAVRSQAAA